MDKGHEADVEDWAREHLVRSALRVPLRAQLSKE